MSRELYVRNSPKLIRAWAMYDWANSVYSLTIATAIFPIYYSEITSAINNGIVHILGRQYTNDALYSYTVSASFLAVAVLSPLLAPLADQQRNKLAFLQFFCYLGALSCGLLFFFQGSNLGWGLGCFGLASFGFASSLVYYNAFLKDIADERFHDRISAWGYSLGYAGSVILLILNLLLILRHDWFGLADSSQATRISFIAVGVWWVLFAQIPFYALRRFQQHSTHHRPGTKLLTAGYRRLRHVYNEVKKHPELRRYLIAFFFFNAGVQTVMYLASLYGAEIIFRDDPQGTVKLIGCVLAIQLIAIGGAQLFWRLSARKGNAPALLIAIILWMCISAFAYFINTEYEFYAVAVLVGLVMGGTQALARSTYAKLIPTRSDSASFFSFFDATEKIATVAGTALFGLVADFSGELRNVSWMLFLLFASGGLLLWPLQRVSVLRPLGKTALQQPSIT
ncbi:MAG: MFS transporter [Chitinophagales bacterium]|nr:MFS transporter [Chitinophagales bacterium]MDW8427403.1 MFS transporter [Chitinophagales bacterium]